MSALPWWLWVAIVVVGVFLWLRRAAKGWRASVRAEFIEYLRREAPSREIVAERDRELEIKSNGGSTATLRLDRLFSQASALPEGDAAGRQALFAKVVGMLEESERMALPDPERDRKRLRPRLASDGFLQQLRVEVKDATIPAVASGVPGLSVVFVLDSDSSVAYVTESLLASLSLSPDDALLLAKANLAPTFDAAIVRRAVSGGKLMMVKSGDTFDAARILLVSAHLQEGENIAAVIPDRDTLALLSVPADGDWSKLGKLAKAAAGPVLWDTPLLVTPLGISALPSSSGAASRA